MKATRTQVEERVAVILQMRLAGAEFTDLVQYAAVQQWNVKERQLWYYVARADERLAEITEEDRAKMLRLHLAQRRLMYAKAMETGDYRAALAVKKDEAELLRLYHQPAPDEPPEIAPPKTAADVVALLGTVLAEVRSGKQEPARATWLC
jgi:hypothetical protein